MKGRRAPGLLPAPEKKCGNFFMSPLARENRAAKIGGDKNRTFFLNLYFFCCLIVALHGQNHLARFRWNR